MRMKQGICVLLCLIISLMPVLSLAEGEEITNTESVPSEAQEENTTDAVVEEPAQEETKEEIEQPVEEPTEIIEETKAEEVVEEKKEEQPKEEVKTETKVEEKKEEVTIDNTVTTVTSTPVTTYKEETAYFAPEISTKLRYPLSRRATLTSKFGPRAPILTPMGYSSSNHGGIDLAIGAGTPVLAAEAGTITKAEYWGGYGNMVEVTHDNGLATRYGHMSEINVKTGQRVVRGQQIGRVGTTGMSSGNHLHFEVWVNGKTVDPLPYLSAPNTNEEYQFCNVKFLFVRNDIDLDTQTEVVKIKEKVSNDEMYMLDEVEVKKTKLFTDEDVIFQLNEWFDITIEDGKTIVDISEFYNNGLLKDEPATIQSQDEFKAEFVKEEVKDEEENVIDYKYLIVINKEVTQPEVQLLFNSDEIQKKNVITKIDSDFDTIKSDIYQFSPLFEMRLELNIEDITKENISIMVDNKQLTPNYYEYEEGVLSINYSCLYLTELDIRVSSEKTEVSTDLPEVKSINRISTWIDANDIDLFGLSSFIEDCYVISSLSDANVETEYFLPQYNKYNLKVDEDKIEGSVLIDNVLADGFISIPVESMSTSMTFETELDELLYDETKPEQTLNIDSKLYNLFIYGEKLDITNKKNIEEGYKTVTFSLLDYEQIENDSYFVFFYKVEGIGGYFGIKVTSED